MSRILYVTDDDRQIPEVACWWRLVLPRNQDGIVCIQQWHMPPGREWPEYKPWSAHLDYFDGRNDWTWPFQAHVTQPDPHWDRFTGSFFRTDVHYLNVLDVLPPDVTQQSRWIQLTDPGNHQYANHLQHQRPGCRAFWNLELRPRSIGPCSYADWI